MELGWSLAWYAFYLRVGQHTRALWTPHMLKEIPWNPTKLLFCGHAIVCYICLSRSSKGALKNLWRMRNFIRTGSGSMTLTRDKSCPPKDRTYRKYALEVHAYIKEKYIPKILRMDWSLCSSEFIGIDGGFAFSPRRSQVVEHFSSRPSIINFAPAFVSNPRALRRTLPA